MYSGLQNLLTAVSTQVSWQSGLICAGVLAADVAVDYAAKRMLDTAKRKRAEATVKHVTWITADDPDLDDE